MKRVFGLGVIFASMIMLFSCGSAVDSAQKDMKAAVDKMTGIIKDGTVKVKSVKGSSEIAGFINATTDEAKKCIGDYNTVVEKNQLTPEQKVKIEESLKDSMAEKINAMNDFHKAIGDAIMMLSTNQIGIAEVQSALENSKAVLNF
jgi:hypothetical protein